MVQRSDDVIGRRIRHDDVGMFVLADRQSRGTGVPVTSGRTERDVGWRLSAHEGDA
jgi:hypothetical protein